MHLSAIYANLNCTDLHRSERWFRRMFGRRCDRRPMPGLVEWRYQGGCGFQLFENPDDAGKGTLTLLVQDVRKEHERLSKIAPGQLEIGNGAPILRLHDPDGNLVVLAESGD